MEASKIFYRKALMDLGLRWTDYVAGRFSKADQVRLSKKVEGLSTLPIFYKDTSFAVSDIMAISAQYVKAHKVGLICVDYIQRVVPPNRSDNRESEVASISSALKSIAMDLQVPVLAVSQTNEQLKTRESRAIEMDMDKMILIGTNKTPRDETTENVEIGITQRMGVSIELGEISLPYDRRCGKWLSGGEVFTGAVVGFE
jgi:replicative DNA helicase